MTAVENAQRLSPFIVDAEGVFHNLAKGAFDAITIRNPNEPARSR